MDLHVFVTMLVLVSTLTTLSVEAIKNATDTKKPAVIAIVMAIVLSVLVGGTYPILFGVPYTIQYAVMILWLVILSAICSQVGYDKVKKALEEALGK